MIDPTVKKNDIQAFHAARKEAGKRIDPNNAEVASWYVQMLDPYGVWEDLLPEEYCLGSEKFARSPDSDGWVWFGDLPDATLEELRRKVRCGELPNKRVETFLKLWYMIRSGELTLSDREDFRARLEALLKEFNSTEKGVNSLRHTGSETGRLHASDGQT